MHDIVITGGGIVGLATGLKLLEQKPSLSVLILEKEDRVARHQTGHNSGVIHSGLYYKPGSMKAINCIRGYQMLIDFCNREGVPIDLCGKIVVATNRPQLQQLATLHDRGLQNGLTQNRKIGRSEMKEIEPHVEGLEGLWVPYTGIVDYVSVAEKYKELFEKRGGEIRFGEKVTNIVKKAGHTEVITHQDHVFSARLLINCAGLYSDSVASLTQTEPLGLQIIPFRGEYYQIKPERAYLVKNLIYPVPDPSFPFLGVHFTRMIGGGVEAGPNAVLAFGRESYKKFDVNFAEMIETFRWPGFQKVASKYWRTGLGEMYRSFSKAAFTKALQELIPDISEHDLIPGGAGVRAQACDRNGGLLDDFAILETAQAINVCNAPSPAATSSLSIGQTVAELALKRL